MKTKPVFSVSRRSYLRAQKNIDGDSDNTDTSLTYNYKDGKHHKWHQTVSPSKVLIRNITVETESVFRSSCTYKYTHKKNL